MILHADTKKLVIVEAVESYIKNHFKDWDNLSFSVPKKKTTNKKKRKSQETMDKDKVIWNLYIDSSHFKSYEKKGYCFAQSIMTDEISVSIPLWLRDYKPSKKKHKKKKKDDKNDYFHLKGKTIVGVDPGKHSIIYLTSNEWMLPKGKTQMQISNVERCRALGTKVFRFIQQKKKRQHED